MAHKLNLNDIDERTIESLLALEPWTLEASTRRVVSSWEVLSPDERNSSAYSHEYVEQVVWGYDALGNSRSVVVPYDAQQVIRDLLDLPSEKARMEARHAALAAAEKAAADAVAQKAALKAAREARLAAALRVVVDPGPYKRWTIGCIQYNGCELLEIEYQKFGRRAQTHLVEPASAASAWSVRYDVLHDGVHTHFVVTTAAGVEEIYPAKAEEPAYVDVAAKPVKAAGGLTHTPLSGLKL